MSVGSCHDGSWAVLFVDQAACLFAACLFAATFIGANVVPACNALVELAYPKLCCNYVTVDCRGSIYVLAMCRCRRSPAVPPMSTYGTALILPWGQGLSMLQRQCSLLAAVLKCCKLLGMHLQMAQYLEWHVALLHLVCKVCKIDMQLVLHLRI